MNLVLNSRYIKKKLVYNYLIFHISNYILGSNNWSTRIEHEMQCGHPPTSTKYPEDKIFAFTYPDLLELKLLAMKVESTSQFHKISKEMVSSLSIPPRWSSLTLWQSWIKEVVRYGAKRFALQWTMGQFQITDMNTLSY